MSQETVARRYARAVFEIGKDEGSLAALTRELGAVAAVFAGSEELRTVLENPLVDDGSREAVLTEIGQRLGLAPMSLNTLRLLARRRRLAAIPHIARELERLSDEDGRIVRAEVMSAGPLTEAYLERLRAELERATGRKVAITHQQDPSLIAGVVTRIGDRMIDGSVKARLNSFRESLLTS